MLLFRRITTSGRFVPEIDGLRFVAIASVVFYHLYSALPEGGSHLPLHTVFLHGYRGVGLFYAISGFVLALPFALHYLAGAPPVSLKAYYIRRLTRLEPPYIIDLLLCSAILFVGYRISARTILPHLGASILYLHNLIYGAHSIINPVAWTLEVEVQFYCLMPLFALFFAIPARTTRRAALLSVILVAALTQFVFLDAPPRLRVSILFAIQFFLTGLLLADIYVVDWKQRPAADWRWDLISFVGWPVAFLLPARESWPCFPFLILLLYMGALRGVIFSAIFRNSLISTIGGMCYTIYLLHYRLIPVVTKRFTSIPVKIAVYLVVLALASSAYFLLIERPCMRKDWPRRLYRAATGR
ncbi:MAG TPA: acyltransferase [Bryobacteraceae bacterium]|nr:acyltransferase [Bryobacteraceae bacterium]